MRLTLYQVDAFTDQLFGGNPAAVVPLDGWLSEAQMQAIAAENNLSETVTRHGNELALDFPAWPAVPIAPLPMLAAALGRTPSRVLAPSRDYLAVYEREEDVAALTPDFAALARLDRRGIIATAPGAGELDFVSRFFAPASGIPEDPVTGSAHCTLVPYWAERLGKTRLKARQISARVGDLSCEDRRERVTSPAAVCSTWKGRSRFERSTQSRRPQCA
jgi:predicted PhzF superfamily epimerase YddE/YHI9